MGVRAWEVATPAMQHVALELGFATIRWVLVAIAPARRASHRANPSIAGGRAIDGTARTGACSAIQDVTLDVRFAAVIGAIIAIAIASAAIGCGTFASLADER